MSEYVYLVVLCISPLLTCLCVFLCSILSFLFFLIKPSLNSFLEELVNFLLEFKHLTWITFSPTNWTDILCFEPSRKALRVEDMSQVTWQRCHQVISLEFNKAYGTLILFSELYSVKWDLWEILNNLLLEVILFSLVLTLSNL